MQYLLAQKKRVRLLLSLATSVLMASASRCTSSCLSQSNYRQLSCLVRLLLLRLLRLQRQQRQRIVAKPLGDYVLKLVKPTVKKVVKKLKEKLGKKIVPESVAERRKFQKFSS